jgi:dolichol kinase
LITTIYSIVSYLLCYRTKGSTGLWLGPLIGLSALMTFLKEDNSYSEICLLTGIAGGGLIVSCTCLYIRLMMKNIAAKDFHVVYFLPAITLSTLFLLVGNKGKQLNDRYKNFYENLKIILHCK